MIGWASELGAPLERSTLISVRDGFIYVGNRADSSVCAIDATSLARGGCVTLPSSPVGVAFVASSKEVWVTMPRDASIAILDVSKPAAPALGGTIKQEGGPEGYALDGARGFFYTNLEDNDHNNAELFCDYPTVDYEATPAGDRVTVSSGGTTRRIPPLVLSATTAQLIQALWCG